MSCHMSAQVLAAWYVTGALFAYAALWLLALMARRPVKVRE